MVSATPSWLTGSDSPTEKQKVQQQINVSTYRPDSEKNEACLIFLVLGHNSIYCLDFDFLTSISHIGFIFSEPGLQTFYPWFCIWHHGRRRQFVNVHGKSRKSWWPPDECNLLFLHFSQISQNVTTHFRITFPRGLTWGRGGLWKWTVLKGRQCPFSNIPLRQLCCNGGQKCPNHLPPPQQIFWSRPLPILKWCSFKWN